VLLALALACGGLAASRVSRLEREVEARVGPGLPVVVAARDLEAGERIPRSALRVLQVPARYVPPDALASVEEATGTSPAGAVPRGGYVTAGRLGGEPSGRRPAPLRAGERAVSVAVAGGEALAGAPPGARVDVLVSSEPGAGAGRTVLALEGVELLGAGGSRATLRVTARQAVYLTAAANYARELRLLVRPPGDRSRVGAAAVEAGEL
jgi:pilus assembly protein CpaB